MPQQQIKTTIFDVFKVTILNITAFGISISDVKEIVQIISLVLAACYTGYKFYLEIKHN